jgi:hypothetical protein
MSQDNQEIQADTMIIVRDAYLSLYYFVNAYWERGRRQDGKVVLLMDGIGPREQAGQVENNDPAFRDDWLDALMTALSRGFPNEQDI